jgi:hypothetical protein
LSAEVLVMCHACARPQRAGPAHCAWCATPLGSVPLPPGATAPPDLEAGLGKGTLALIGDRLELRQRTSGRRQFALHSVRSVRLVQRPLFEALGLSFAACLLIATCPWLWGRLLMIPVMVVSAALCFTERRIRLKVTLDTGERERFDLGTAPRDRADRLTARFLPLAEALSERGVEVGPDA